MALRATLGFPDVFHVTVASAPSVDMFDADFGLMTMYRPPATPGLHSYRGCMDRRSYQRKPRKILMDHN